LHAEIQELRAAHAQKAAPGKPVPVPQPPGVTAPPGAKPQMAGGFGGGFGGGFAFQPGMAGGTKPAGIEQRLEQVERKLDALLWEITNMRRDLAKGTPMSGGWGVGGMGPMGPGGMPPGGGAPGK